jgi:hypothetical protein
MNVVPHFANYGYTSALQDIQVPSCESTVKQLQLDWYQYLFELEILLCQDIDLQLTSQNAARCSDDLC